MVFFRLFFRKYQKIIIAAASLWACLASLETILKYSTSSYWYWMEYIPQAFDLAFVCGAPYKCDWKSHPDRLEKHRVIYNGLGLSQQREFSVGKSQGFIRVGIFGDSFAQNNGMPAPYSFSEPLDYLLNSTGKQFEVLNFGRNGFGIDTSYFRYLVQGRHLDLDVVIYLYRQNDAPEICIHPTFDLNADGEFLISPKLPVPICSTYRTCLLTDAKNHMINTFNTLFSKWRGVESEPPLFQRELESGSPENWPLWNGKTCQEYSQPLFEKILQYWNREAVSRGGRFVVALACDSNRDCDSNSYFTDCEAAALIREKLNIPSIDLVEPIQRYQSNTGRSLLFRHDCHWNEEGCKLVSVELFKVIAAYFGLVSEDEFIAEKLSDYYNSFPEIPTGPYFIQNSREWSDIPDEKIRKKYFALDDLIEKKKIRCDE